MLTDAFNQDLPRSHTIDLFTQAGLADFLTIFNYIELANVLYSKTYAEGLSRREFADFVEARRLSRAILQIYHAQYSLALFTGGKTISILGLQREYLAGQVRALVRYKGEMDAIKVTNNIPLDSFLDELLSLSEPDDFLLVEAVEGTGGRPNDPFQHSFAWPAEFNRYGLTSRTSAPPGRQSFLL